MDPVLLDTTVRPSPPLPPAALKAVLAIVVCINLAFASFFVFRGAWVVTVAAAFAACVSIAPCIGLTGVVVGAI